MQGLFKIFLCLTKDRLHRNYLRRKENGKQREYEERTKAVKKAEIDAKKEAIRAEDIQKGAFVAVGHLSKNEPQKADWTA
jgi:predicted Holliday junction resolvase-like endonuclease